MEGNSGNAVPNQFIIETKNGVYFQSYSTMIAFKPFGVDKKIELDKDSWDYSRTTMKYLNKFLGVRGKKEIEHRIKDGRYVLKDLNQGEE